MKDFLQDKHGKMKTWLIIGLGCIGILGTTGVFAEEAVSTDTSQVSSAKAAPDKEPAAEQVLPEEKTLKELVTRHPDNAGSKPADKASDSDVAVADDKLEDKPDSPSLMQEGFKTIGMLTLLLIGFWWVSNWLKKSGKLARMRNSQGNIDCVSVYSVGQKEKIALFKVNGEELLVGITQHSIQTLYHFSKDGKSEGSVSVVNKDAHSEAEFAKVLDSAGRNVPAQ